LREAANDGEQLARSEGPPWERAIELQTLCQTLLILGRLDDAAKITDQVDSMAARIGQSYLSGRSLMTKAWVNFGKTAELTEFETIRQVLESDPKVPPAFWEVFAEVQLCLLDFFRGDWASALQHAQTSYRLESEISLRGAGTGTFFRQMAYAGDLEGALAILHEKRAWLPRSGQPNTMGSWWMLALVIEGLFVLGEHSEAGELYPLARELVDTGAIAVWPIMRFASTAAGIAASAAGQWEAAEDHFQLAMQQAESIPHRLEQAEIRRFHAMMLMNRAATGDREIAKTLLAKALETYTRVGMPRHIEMTQTVLDRCQ
jgi:tetratricopeptide (TPR) repeat protein